MTDHDFDRRLHAFVLDGPESGTPAGLAAALERSRTMRQRPAWRTRTWAPSRPALPRTRPAQVAWVALAMLLTVAIAIIGSRLLHRLPDNGPILLSVEHTLTRFDDTSSAGVVVGLPGEKVKFPAWSPNGKHAAFWTTRHFLEPWELVITDGDLEHRRVVSGPIPVYNDPSELAWSPDGQRLLFEVMDGDGVWQVMVAGLDGAEPMPVAPTLNGGQAVWSPDGTWIALRGQDHPDLPTLIGLYLVRPDGSELHPVFTSGYANWLNLTSPTWSPDGRHLAFVWYGDAWWVDGMPTRGEVGRFVATLDLDTGEVRDVSAGLVDQDPIWSPDGEWIVFRRATTGTVMIARPDGSEVRPVVADARENGFAWSPDGTRLLVITGVERRLVEVAIDGSETRLVDVSGAITEPSWGAKR
jgi:Tol biopolymer transport system component